MSAGASRADERRVELDGALNARHLGGISAADGRRFRDGLVYRMDSPQFLTEAGAQELLGERGLRTIIDLRYPRESSEEGIGHLAVDDVVHVNIPVASSERQTAPGLREMLEAEAGRPLDEVRAEYYRGYFTTADGAAIVSAISELLRPNALPALIHCAAGKDRTGSVVAILLSALGASDDEVIDDYAASDPNVPGIIGRLHDLGTYTEIDQSSVALQGSKPDTMRLLLQWVNETYGGAREFLLARGLTEDDLTRLADLLLTEPE